MDLTQIGEVLVLGVMAGTIAGMFGVGGGVLFVPVLTLIVGLGQIEAEGTSLLAMVPVAVIGGIVQYRRGFITLRAMFLVGAFSGLGAVIGAFAANSVPEETLRRCFGVFLLFIASQLLRRAISERRARIAGVPSDSNDGIPQPKGVDDVR